jgi:hypothetical protein
VLGRLTGAGRAWLVAAALVLGGPASGATAPLPPFACAGPLAPDASHAALEQAFGKANVVFKTVPGPEGTTARATVVFDRDPARRLEVQWHDEKRRRRPAFVTVREGALWRTPQGLGMGSSLAEAERANGGPFLIAGFDWDYAGTVTDWNGGALDGGPCRLILRFEPGAGGSGGADAQGDQDFPSDGAAMRAAKPVAYEMSLSYQ